MFDYLRSKLPKRHEVVSHWTIRPFAHRLRHPRLWHLHRIGVSRAFFIGLFCAFIPVPIGQMLLAAVWAWFARANIPVAIASTWLTNPFTYLPFIFAAFWIGNQILFYTLPNWESAAFSLSNVWSRNSVLYPILLGSLIFALASAFAGSAISRYLWRQRILAKKRKRDRERLDQSVAG